MSLVKSENQFNTKMQVGISNLTILNSKLLLTHSTVHYQKIFSKKFSTKNYKLKNGTLASSGKLWVKVQNKCLLIIWIIYSLNHSFNKILFSLAFVFTPRSVFSTSDTNDLYFPWLQWPERVKTLLSAKKYLIVLSWSK